MNKKILLVMTAIGLLACNFLFPPKETTGPESRSLQNSASEEFNVIRLHPEDGDLPTLLAQEAQKATALGLLPVVEFDASWCPPCQAIDKAIEEENELVLDAYAGTYIIKLDVDEWGWGDSNLHDFDFDGIPVYFKLDGNGVLTGETVDGNAWGENIPENFAPVMDEFFHGE